MDSASDWTAAFPTPDWVSPCGNAILYNRDCLSVLPEIPAESIDCVVTDPPYGHNNNNGDLIHRWEAALGRLPCGEAPPLARPIANDGAEANELFRDVLPFLHRILAPGCCCCCCCGGGGPDPQFARWSLLMDGVFQFKQMVVWDKGPMGMGWHYRRSYETVLVAEKKGAACRWYGGHCVENIIRPDSGIRKIIPSADDHPTPKPIELYGAFIGYHTVHGELVVDPFMGRGPCGVAALRGHRRFVGIELDKEHFDFACERIASEHERFSLFNAARETQQELFSEK